jgi:hypothetical protein
VAELGRKHGGISRLEHRRRNPIEPMQKVRRPLDLAIQKGAIDLVDVPVGR